MTGFWKKTKKNAILAAVNHAGKNSPEALVALLS